MATATIIRPNGPLPESQPPERPSELPRPYKCPLCVRAFHRLEHQTRHIRTHTGEKPHACQYPGCSKRFSRSDELTRHSRIHNNPHSRRGKTHQQQLSHLVALNAPRPSPKAICSAPPSTLASPNVSPPPSYLPFPMPSPLPTSAASGMGTYARAPQPSMDVGMLATAANRVERETRMAPPPHPAARPAPFYAQKLHPSHGHLSSLAAYQPPRAAPPQDDYDNHYAHAERLIKRSRPNSPNSTAPSSPTFSHSSLSPTPNHTPLVTPAHSPRLRPFHYSYELPHLRNLSLHANPPPPPPPTLPPIEPLPEKSFGATTVPPTASRSHGISLSDIVTTPIPQSETLRRKSPVTKVAVRDLLGPSDSALSAPPGRGPA